MILKRTVCLICYKNNGEVTYEEKIIKRCVIGFLILLLLAVPSETMSYAHKSDTETLGAIPMDKSMRVEIDDRRRKGAI